jgi:hypothetical protein
VAYALGIITAGVFFLIIVVLFVLFAGVVR